MWNTVLRPVLLFATLLCAGAVLAQDTRYFTIATGSTAGTYFPVGSLIAGAVSRPEGSSPCDEGGACGVDNLIATAVTTRGSFENIEGIASGRFDSGLAQADIVAWAYQGAAIYTGKGSYPDLRAIANLYPEFVHLVARKDLKIQSINDLIGYRVAIDREGSGTRINALLILGAFGLEHSNIHAVSAGPEAAITGLLDGQVDAAFFVVGYPSTAVTELMETGGFDLVSISGVAVDQLMIANRYYAPGTVPADVYATQEDVSTLTVGAQLVTHATVSEELVHAITTALWREENQNLLHSGHVAARLMSIEKAVEGVTIPFHVGAKRFYEEQGILK
jgi:TRAP transporter TAXI family solute receptor